MTARSARRGILAAFALPAVSTLPAAAAAPSADIELLRLCAAVETARVEALRLSAMPICPSPDPWEAAWRAYNDALEAAVALAPHTAAGLREQAGIILDYIAGAGPDADDRDYWEQLAFDMIRTVAGRAPRPLDAQPGDSVPVECKSCFPEVGAPVYYRDAPMPERAR